MERVEKFLKDAGTYYLATADKDQPRIYEQNIRLFSGIYALS